MEKARKWGVKDSGTMARKRTGRLKSLKEDWKRTGTRK